MLSSNINMTSDLLLVLYYVVLTCSVSSVMNSSGAFAHSAGRIRVSSLLRHAGFPKNREVN